MPLVAVAARVMFHGDGSQSRDFTYVENVLAATLAAGEHMGTMGWQAGATLRQALLGDWRNAARRCKMRP